MQFFHFLLVLNRWFEYTLNEFIGVLHAYIIRLRHENALLYYEFYANISDDHSRRSTNEADVILRNYFQFSIKLEELIDQWSKTDERFGKKLIPLGIRVLDQDPLENLLSFICSSNNNVQRITKMVKSLCEKYGKLIGNVNGIPYHQFPTIGNSPRKNSS